MRRVEQAINKWHVMFRFFFMKWPTQIWAKLWKLKTEKLISFPGRALPVALRWWQQAADDPLACRVNLCARNYWTSVICSSLGFTNKEILRRSSFNRWFIWFIALPEAIVWICKHNKTEEHRDEIKSWPIRMIVDHSLEISRISNVLKLLKNVKIVNGNINVFMPEFS